MLIRPVTKEHVVWGLGFGAVLGKVPSCWTLDTRTHSDTFHLNLLLLNSTDHST